MAVRREPRGTPNAACQCGPQERSSAGQRACRKEIGPARNEVASILDHPGAIRPACRCAHAGYLLLARLIATASPDERSDIRDWLPNLPHPHVAALMRAT